MFIPFNQQLFPYGKYRIYDVEIEIIDHFLHGVSTPKGLKVIQKYKQLRIKK